ncbi:hypothetical protein COO58_09240 [Micromonospora sp. WMMA1996]|nr:hypothetical protein COO58_09240 [Micromonospora sp. WMMA1996]
MPAILHLLPSMCPIRTLLEGRNCKIAAVVQVAWGVSRLRRATSSAARLAGPAPSRPPSIMRLAGTNRTPCAVNLMIDG